MHTIEEMSEESFNNLLDTAQAQRSAIPIHEFKRKSWTIRVVPSYPGQYSTLFLFSDPPGFMSVVADRESAEGIQALIDGCKHGADIITQLRRDDLLKNRAK